jgi:hypothetical protein
MGQLHNRQKPDLRPRHEEKKRAYLKSLKTPQSEEQILRLKPKKPRVRKI